MDDDDNPFAADDNPFAADDNPFAEDGDAGSYDGADGAVWGQRLALADDEGEAMDVEDLCGALHGLPIAEAEEGIRRALGKANGNVSEADVAAVLLKLFRWTRDAALGGYEPWDDAVAYCERLTSLCDSNFVTSAGGEAGEGTRDFPVTVVALVYAECGRTLALAGHLGPARDRLLKSISVFGLMPGGDETLRGQTAATRASLARVHRRSGHLEAAQREYLQALELYAQLPPGLGDDLVEFISEYCEVLAEVGVEGLSPSLPALLSEVAAEKLGGGSDDHLKVLRCVAETYETAGHPELAVTALVMRAKLLVANGGGGLARAEAEEAAEAAAQMLEGSLPALLGEGNLDGAIAAWAEALEFREFTEPPKSELVESMRATLAALEQAAKERAAAAGPSADGEVEPARSEPGDGDAEAKPASGAPSLRPQWAKGKGTGQGTAEAEEAVDDGWDA